MKIQKPQTAKTILRKKTEAGGIVLPDFRLYYKTAIIKVLCIISYMKRVSSPGSMHDTGCLGLVRWDDPEGWYVEGGGFRMGNTCIPVADSF